MPFTFSHPALILPLAKINSKYISASALVIGSMAPDFEYFVNMRLKQIHGHTLTGVFYYDLPITILSLFIFHMVVRNTLIEHLPEFLRTKYKIYQGFDWIGYFKKRWYVVFTSSLIGIFSHLFWDAFTHGPGYFAQQIPFLQQDIHLGDLTVKCFYLMQFLSTLVGGLIVSAVIFWPAKNDQIKKQLTYSYWQKTGQYALSVFGICIVVMLVRDIKDHSEFIATSIAGTLIGTVLAPLVLQLKKLLALKMRT